MKKEYEKGHGGIHVRGIFANPLETPNAQGAGVWLWCVHLLLHHHRPMPAFLRATKHYVASECKPHVLELSITGSL